jgi:2'-5' RNA ligase
MILSSRVIEAYLKQAYNFSSVQVEFPDDISEELIKWGYDNIPEDILAEDGFEEDKHVTIKYGIHIIDFTEIRELFKNEKPIKMVLGKMSLFTSNDDFDVVKIDIKSPDLYRLNRAISNNFEVTNTHKKYIPHCTIAYVKKGKGDPYNGNDTFEGREAISDTILFSGKDNRHTVFKLLNEKKNAVIKDIRKLVYALDKVASEIKKDDKRIALAIDQISNFIERRAFFDQSTWLPGRTTRTYIKNPKDLPNKNEKKTIYRCSSCNLRRYTPVWKCPRCGYVMQMICF